MKTVTSHSRSLLCRPCPGFSLPELLVIVVIIGVIGAVGIGGFNFLVRRARVQSVALEVAGWLEQVRNAAADEVIANTAAGGCVVTFDSGNRTCWATDCHSRCRLHVSGNDPAGSSRCSARLRESQPGWQPCHVHTPRHVD